jgi:hypothetical protein
MSDMTGTPAPTPQEGKSRSWLLIVIVLAVVCCLVAACVAAGWYVWNNGDRWLDFSLLWRGVAAV